MKKMKISFLVIILNLILFTPVFSQGGLINPPNHDPYERQHNFKHQILNYSPLREADVMWQKRVWRTIDLRQKINHPFYYPTEPQNGRASFMHVLWQAVMQGQVKAYVYEDYDSEFDEIVSPDQIKLDFADTSYVAIIDLNTGQPTGYEDTIVIPFEPKSVFKLIVKEDWFIDKQRSVMDVRISGIAPITIDTKGRDLPMFWVYFPELRTTITKSPVYNRYNDTKRLTFDDLFAKRFFDSYVIKESSVYDRYIAEYKIGLDALLEAEKIKEEIFIKEHDLWEF